MKRLCRIIDKEALREKASPGKLPAFAYNDGTRPVLLPNGQQIRHPQESKDRTVSGKAARRQRIKERHAVIIGTKVMEEGTWVHGQIEQQLRRAER